MSEDNTTNTLIGELRPLLHWEHPPQGLIDDILGPGPPQAARDYVDGLLGAKRRRWLRVREHLWPRRRSVKKLCEFLFETELALVLQHYACDLAQELLGRYPDSPIDQQLYLDVLDAKRSWMQGKLTDNQLNRAHKRALKAINKLPAGASRTATSATTFASMTSPQSVDMVAVCAASAAEGQARLDCEHEEDADPGFGYFSRKDAGEDAWHKENARVEYLLQWYLLRWVEDGNWWERPYTSREEA